MTTTTTHTNELGRDGLRAYQREAVAAITAGLAEGGRGQVRAACGSGKTKVGLHAAARLAAEGLVVVLVPSLALVAQTLTVWRAAHGAGLAACAVCSDQTISGRGKRAEPHPVTVAELPVEVSTSSGWLAGWLARHAGCARLVVGTYDSVDRVADGLRAAGATADLLIADEAHRTAGSAGKLSAVPVREDALPARRRLFMTATARIMGTRNGQAADVYSMDDPERYGPVLYEYPVSRGIAEGYLKNYRLLVIGVPSQDALALLGDAGDTQQDGSARLAAAQVALAKAACSHGLRRVVTFHGRVDDAVAFASTLPDTIDRLPATQRPPGQLTATHVHGGMSTRQRQQSLGWLADPPGGGWTVVSNARVLTEGVDVPGAIDTVVFVTPKQSQVDIVQAVGRALRPSPDGPGQATILIPVLIPDTVSDPEAFLDEDAGAFECVWKVVRALRAHDTTLGEELDAARVRLADRKPAALPGRIRVELPAALPAEVASGLLAQLSVRVIRAASSGWWDGYTAAVATHAELGHINVSSRFRTPDGYALGQWVMRCRRDWRLGRLSADRVALLEAVGLVWEPHAARWWTFYSQVQAFHQHNGHVRIPRPPWTSNEPNLQLWLFRQQRNWDQLTPKQRAALEALGFRPPANQPEKPAPWWQQGLDAARAYHAQHHDLDARGHVTADGLHLGRWLIRCRYLHRRGRLPAELKTALDALGMAWDPDEDRWQAGYAAASAHRQAHGNLDVGVEFATPTGYPLGSWLHEQKRLYHGKGQGTLRADRRGRLEALGIDWTTRPPGRRPKRGSPQRQDNGAAAAAPAEASPTQPQSSPAAAGSAAAYPTRHVLAAHRQPDADQRDTFGHHQERRLVELLGREGQRVWQATPAEHHAQIDFWVVAPKRQIPIQATVATDPDILAHKHGQLAGRGIALLALPHQLLTQAQAANPRVRQTATGHILTRLAEAVAAVPTSASDPAPWPWTDWLLGVVARIHQELKAADANDDAAALLRRWRRLALLAVHELGVGHRHLSRLLDQPCSTLERQVSSEHADLRIQDEKLRGSAPTANPAQRIILREWVTAIRLAERQHGRRCPNRSTLPQMATVVAAQQAIWTAARHFAIPKTDLLQVAGLRPHELDRISQAPVNPDPGPRSGIDVIELLSRAAEILAGLLVGTQRPRRPTSIPRQTGRS